MTRRLDKIFDEPDPTLGPRYNLVNLGPTIKVRVELHPQEQQIFATENPGMRAPTWDALAIIDTGAAFTVIDEDIQRALQPTVHSYVPLKGLHDQQAIMRPVFHIRITMLEGDLPAWDKVAAAAPVPSKTGRDLVILGRDFLWSYKFVYDGPNGKISLSTIE